MIERASASFPGYEHPGNEKPSPKSGSKKKIIVLCLYSVITMTGLSRANTLDGLRLRLCWLFAQLVLYWGLFQRVSQSDGLKSGAVAETFKTATELSSFLVLIMIPLASLWWHQIASVSVLGMISALKASRWISVLILVCTPSPHCNAASKTDLFRRSTPGYQLLHGPQYLQSATTRSGCTRMDGKQALHF